MAYQHPQYPPRQQEPAVYNNWNNGVQEPVPPAAAYNNWNNGAQEPAVYNNWNNGAQQPSSPIAYNTWNSGVPDPAVGTQNAWNNGAPQVPPGQWHQPPVSYAAEGIARAHNWVANQPTGSVMSPPPTAKTPFSEYGTDSVADHHTIRSYPFPSTTGGSPPNKRNNRICGVKRSLFFIVLAIGAFVLVAGIATGLGVGLALAKNEANTSAASAPVTTSASSSAVPTATTATPTTQTSATSTKVSPTPSFTGTVVKGPVLCPGNNGTVYISSVTSKPFDIKCGRDYNSDNGAADLTHMAASTMADCIDHCGSNSKCVGAGWGNYQGTYTCWLKSDLGEPNQSPNWYFAVLQSSDSG